MAVKVEGASEPMVGIAMAGSMEPGGGAHAHDTHCRNCGTALVGTHCHCCGQAGHLHRTIGGFLHEIAHSVFHFDGKFWLTLPLLAWRPGELMRRYIDGERAKFVSPVALFLFSVFLLFAIVPRFAGAPDWGGFTEPEQGLAQVATDVSRQTEKAREAVAKLERRRAAVNAVGGSTAKLDDGLAEARSELLALQRAAGALPLPEDASPKVRADKAEAAGVDVNIGSEAADRWFEERIAQARENPKLLIYKMKTAAYKYSWALIPLSLPFLWLMFAWRRRFGLYDHAVFATYSLSFMSLLVVALTLFNAVPNALIVATGWIGFFVIPPVHMYKQLRGGYRLRRFSAAWRTAALLVVVTVTSTMFFLLMLYFGVAD